jgi:hypothetical protein
MRYRTIGVIAMACLLALGLAVVAISSVPARTQDNLVKTYPGGPTAGEGTAQGENLATTKHVLKSEFYDTNGGASLTCFGSFCHGEALLFQESIACPGPVGTKCTYEIDVAAQTVVSPAGDTGYYQFLIDGAIPTGGGTDPTGAFQFEQAGAGGQYSAEYSVTSQVQNVAANQSHVITVNLGCADSMGTGSSNVTTGFSDLTIGVLKP